MHHDQQLEHMMKILSAKQVLHHFIKYTYCPEDFRKEPETYSRDDVTRLELLVIYTN
jgi:hypothetical protein